MIRKKDYQNQKKERLKGYDEYKEEDIPNEIKIIKTRETQFME